MFTPMGDRNGGALCLACPIIQTVIFRPIKTKTISTPTSLRTYLSLRLSGIASSAMTRGSDSASGK
jgi:hypothetical protein